MLKTEANTIKWIGNKYVNEVVTKDLNRFLIELSVSLQNQKKSYATVDKVKLDSNEEGHYLNLNEIRYGKRGSAGWEDHREFSLLLKVI